MWIGHRLYQLTNFFGCISMGTPEIIFAAMQGYPFYVLLGWPMLAFIYFWVYAILFPFMLIYSAMFVIIIHDTLNR